MAKKLNEGQRLERSLAKHLVAEDRRRAKKAIRDAQIAERKKNRTQLAEQVKAIRTHEKLEAKAIRDAKMEQARKKRQHEQAEAKFIWDAKRAEAENKKRQTRRAKAVKKKESEIKEGLKGGVIVVAKATTHPIKRLGYYGGIEAKKIGSHIESYLKHRKEPSPKPIAEPKQTIYYWILGRDGITFKLQGAYKDSLEADKEGYKAYQSYTVIPLHTDNAAEAQKEMVRMGLTNESEVSKYILTNG